METKVDENVSGLFQDSKHKRFSVKSSKIHLGFGEEMASVSLMNGLVLTLYWLKPPHLENCIGYDLKRGDDILFAGDEFKPSPLYCLDSVEAMRDCLSFLVIKEGDVDPEYFQDYLKKQLNWTQSEECENLRRIVVDMDCNSEENLDNRNRAVAAFTANCYWGERDELKSLKKGISSHKHCGGCGDACTCDNSSDVPGSSK